MIKLIIASSKKDKVRPWVDALRTTYSLSYFDNTEQIMSDKNNNEKVLLVLDASLLTNSGNLSLICQSFYKVLVVNEHRSSDQKIQYIYEGAWGYSDYSVNKQLIVRTIESILNNEVWLERHLIPQLLQGAVTRSRFFNKGEEALNPESLAKLSILTHREIEVISLVYHGHDNTSISHALNITNRTVKAHLSAVYRKLKVLDRFQLLIFLKDLDVAGLSNIDVFFEANETTKLVNTS